MKATFNQSAAVILSTFGVAKKRNGKIDLAEEKEETKKN